MQLLKGMALAFIYTVLLFAITIGAVSMRVTADDRDWNNGICHYCHEGHWEFHSAIPHRSTTGYLYMCDDCGMIHEFDVFHK